RRTTKGCHQRSWPRFWPPRPIIFVWSTWARASISSASIFLALTDLTGRNHILGDLDAVPMCSELLLALLSSIPRCIGTSQERAHEERPGMDIKRLRLLADIVEPGSLSKVCAPRGSAQSALSKHIAALEDEFGAKLFYRTGRGVVLTEFGQSIMPRVRALL